MQAVEVKMTHKQLQVLTNRCTHYAYIGGIATGKTYTGAHFAIRMIDEHPDKTGFIGANTYDQLSQATLREFFYWLDEYGYDYVVDRQPPKEWGGKKKFKKYSNIVSIRHKGHIVSIFTRVLSDPNPLRGVEFSWYWVDESRDTKRGTFDVILSRLRETKDFMKGLVTTTPAGEDWVYDQFVNKTDGITFGHTRARTVESVEAGIISLDFYRTLRKSYSPLMAAQELDALHVNLNGGQVYYAASNENKSYGSPWGEAFPNPERPLIIGMDFNFAPAPCIWMVGQLSPEGDQIHWYSEIVETQEPNSRSMTRKLIMRYPDFFYRIFGDASGQRGSTSNAGEYDYAQIAEELSMNQAGYTIDVDQANPRVKDRVEAMNSMFKNGIGEHNQTYDPQGCPYFDGDVRMVGWKKQNRTGLGKLDDGGDHNRTHASDGAGYAVFKLFHPKHFSKDISAQVASVAAKEYRNV